MSTVEDGEMSSLQCTLSQRHLKTSNEMERGQTQVDILQEKLIVDVTAGLHGSNENSEKEMEIISRRVKTIATLLNYLKYKERIVSLPHLAHASCTLKLLEELDLTDEDSTSMSAWSSNVDMSSLESPDESSWIKSADHDPRGLVDREDPAYLDEILKVVQMVTDLMEILVKRVIIAESQTELEKEKATLGQEEVKRKTTQIESMYVKLDEMERFAIGTNSVLIEMKQRVEDLVEETCRQRQRAVDNEHELCRVKQDFESLKSYVSSLISVRETLLSSEKQFQTIERLFERLVAKTNQLEGEKVQKDVEVSKLMEENVKLNALLDKKEAQLLAMNEQCKVMALSTSSI